MNYLDLIKKIKEEKNNTQNLNDFILKLQEILEEKQIILSLKENSNYLIDPSYEKFIKIKTCKNEINLLIRSRNILDMETLNFIEIITDEIKNFIEKDEYKQLKTETELLNKLTAVFISKTGIKELLEEILIELKNIVPYVSTNIALLEKGSLSYFTFTGYEKYNADTFMRNFKMDKEKFYTLRTVLETQKPVLVEDTDKFPYWVKIPETSWIKSHLMIPILHEEEILGVISFDSDKPYAFSQEDVKKIYPIIPIIGIALENAKLYEKLTQELVEKTNIEEKLRRSFYQVIKIASDVIEIKDPYTSGHQKKVAQISTIIGKTLDLSYKRIRALTIGALLHDIGKIAIPSEILNKPSKLTSLEKKLVSLHSQIGYDLVKKVEILKDIAPIILQHHERLNGSGYPLGLKGEEILLEARIIAVADVVEAMTSHRPYRPAFPVEVALKEIENNKGILYDPDVVDAFLISLKKGRIRL